jgi:hypothetical protein
MFCVVLFADEIGFTRNGVFNSHNTHIQQHKSRKIQQFCKSSGPSTSKDTSVYYPLVMVFASTFPFTVFSLLVVLHVFAGLCI